MALGTARNLSPHQRHPNVVDVGAGGAGHDQITQRGKEAVANQVDFSQNGNLIVAAVTLILGAGDFSLHFGNFQLGGIGTATFGAIILNALLNRTREQ